MVRYLETFYRRRRLSVLPLAVVMIGSLLLFVVQPPTFTSVTRIWVDQVKISSGSGSEIYSSLTDREAGLLKEMLLTHEFAGRVATDPSLTERLASAEAGASILVRLRIQHPRPAGEDLVHEALTGRAKVSTIGPQILAISYTDHNPQLAADMLKAIVLQFGNELIDTANAKTRAELDVANQTLKTDQTLVDSANRKLADYLAAHPELRAPTATPTADLLRLQQDLADRRLRLDDQTQKQNDLQLTLTEAQSTGFRVIDPAGVPTLATSLMKVVQQAVLPPLLAGLVLMIAGVVVLTLTDVTVRRADELERLIGRPIAGVVPLLRVSARRRVK